MTSHLHDERTCRPRAGVSRRGRRVPFRPLEDWLNDRYRNPTVSADFQTGGELTAPTIGAIIGVTRQTLYRWRDNGIPWWSADAAAIHAGAHPLELWPDFHTSPTTTGEVAA